MWIKYVKRSNLKIYKLVDSNEQSSYAKYVNYLNSRYYLEKGFGNSEI